MCYRLVSCMLDWTPGLKVKRCIKVYKGVF